MFKLGRPALYAQDQTLRLEEREIAPGSGTGTLRHPLSDIAVLFYEGTGEARTADRVYPIAAPCHAHVRAGTAYEFRNTGTALMRCVIAICPAGPTEAGVRHDAPAGPGGVTMLRTDVYGRIPDSGLVRGGMYFQESGTTVPRLSQDASTKVFVPLHGLLDLTVGDETRRIGVGDVVVIPQEVTHALSNPGPEKLAMWVTVTPNVSPSHTRYEQLPDGSWRRITPRASR